MDVYIVFYTIPNEGKSEKGVEAFYDEDECNGFMLEILKNKGAQVEVITTSKNELSRLGKIRA